MVNKSKRIEEYIKENEEDIINNKISVAQIAEKFGVTKQLVYYHASNVSEGLFERREEQLDMYLKQIYRDIKEGIPLDVIIQQTYAQPFLTDKSRANIHRAKDLIVNRLYYRGIPTEEDFKSHILTNAKLKNYVSTLQIEELLKTNEKINKADLARSIGMSHHKVLMINLNINKAPFRELPNASQEFYDILKRNISIAEDFYRIGKRKEVYQKYSKINNHVLRLVIDGFKPFINKKLIINKSVEDDLD